MNWKQLQFVFVLTIKDLLFTELLGNILWRSSWDFDPSLWENGASDENKSNVDDDMDGVNEEVLESWRWGEVVRQSSRGLHLARAGAVHAPRSKQCNKWIAAKLLEKKLRNKVKVGDKGGLQDDGDVAGVEHLKKKMMIKKWIYIKK